MIQGKKAFHALKEHFEKKNSWTKIEEHLKLKKKGWGHSKPKMKDGGKPKGLWANIHAKRKRGEAPA